MLHFEEVNDLTLDPELLLMEYSKNPGMALIQAFAKVRTSWDCTLPWQKHFEKFVLAEGEEFGVPSVSEFYRLYKAYCDYKQKRNVIDFTDMLIMALKGEIDPFQTIREKGVLICDEFQDLYPLAVRVFQLYMENFQDVVIAGDDDQTIFSFTGANPRYFLEDLKGQDFILKQSYRLPILIWNYALKIIEKNTLRKVKIFNPLPKKGKVDTIHKKDILDFLEETAKSKIDTLLLVRTNYHLKEYISMLEEWDIPYGVSIKRAIISEKLIRIIQTHEKLQNKEPVTDLYLHEFCEEVAFPYIRQRAKIKRLSREEKEQIQKALREIAPWKAPKKTIQAVKEILEKPLDEISSYDKIFITKWKNRMKRIDDWLNPKLKVMTIHSAKGLEADRVIVDPRITTKIENSMLTQEGLEAERRVWYVAVTRAKEELFIIDTPTELSFPLPEIQNHL